MPLVQRLQLTTSNILKISSRFEKSKLAVAPKLSEAKSPASFPRVKSDRFLFSIPSNIVLHYVVLPLKIELTRLGKLIMFVDKMKLCSIENSLLINTTPMCTQYTDITRESSNWRIDIPLISSVNWMSAGNEWRLMIVEMTQITTKIILSRFKFILKSTNDIPFIKLRNDYAVLISNQVSFIILNPQKNASEVDVISGWEILAENINYILYNIFAVFGMIINYNLIPQYCKLNNFTDTDELDLVTKKHGSVPVVMLPNFNSHPLFRVQFQLENVMLFYLSEVLKSIRNYNTSCKS